MNIKNNYDIANELLNNTVNKLEKTLGEETNRETFHEGINIFKFECIFNNNGITTIKRFEVSLINRYVKTINKRRKKGLKL